MLLCSACRKEAEPHDNAAFVAVPEPETSTYDLDQIQETETGEEGSSQASVEIHPSYTIQQGDTITKISIKTYGSTEKVREICELNNLSVNDLIYPGQKILLP